jgi:hypothetical protein
MSLYEFGLYATGVCLGYWFGKKEGIKIMMPTLNQYKRDLNTKSLRLINYNKFIEYKGLGEEYKNYKPIIFNDKLDKDICLNLDIVDSSNDR